MSPDASSTGLSSTVAARLGAFALVLALAAAGGWFAGQSVGPIRLPPPATTHHLESR